jgi:hypothetical protein
MQLIALTFGERRAQRRYSALKASRIAMYATLLPALVRQVGANIIPLSEKSATIFGRRLSASSVWSLTVNRSA